jgi:hypothetical protein
MHLFYIFSKNWNSQNIFDILMKSSSKYEITILFAIHISTLQIMKISQRHKHHLGQLRQLVWPHCLHSTSNKMPIRKDFIILWFTVGKTAELEETNLLCTELQYWNGKKMEAHLEYTPKQTCSLITYCW